MGYDRLIILNNRGNAKYDLGNKQGAIADYKKAAKLYQQNSSPKAMPLSTAMAV
jgi:tetratricopeptide (TPR) repeat protein